MTVIFRISGLALSRHYFKASVDIASLCVAPAPAEGCGDTEQRGATLDRNGPVSLHGKWDSRNWDYTTGGFQLWGPFQNVFQKTSIEKK